MTCVCVGGGPQSSSYGPVCGVICLWVVLRVLHATCLPALCYPFWGLLKTVVCVYSMSPCSSILAVGNPDNNAPSSEEVHPFLAFLSKIHWHLLKLFLFLLAVPYALMKSRPGWQKSLQLNEDKTEVLLLGPAATNNSINSILESILILFSNLTSM